jgi:membrane-associated phospholipid phosphatase
LVETDRITDASASRRALVRRCTALAVSCAAFLAVLYVTAVRTTWGQELDDAASLARRRTEWAELKQARELLEHVSPVLLILAGVAIALVAVARRRPRLALASLVVIVGTNATTAVLKQFVLTRPVGAGPEGNAFPSGHTTAAVSLGVAAMLVVPVRLRPWVGLAGAAYGIAVGLATLAGATHRPSEASGAFAVGVVWAAGVSALMVARGAAGRARSRGPVALASTMVAVGAVLLVAGAFRLLDAVNFTRDGLVEVLDLHATFQAGSAAIAGVGLVLFGALALVLRDISLDPPRT